MNISLPLEIARFIRRKVKAGGYTDASEVVRDAVQRLQASEAAKENRQSRTVTGDPENAAAEVRAGYAAIKRGEFTDLEGDDRLKAYLDNNRRRARKELASAKNSRRRTSP